MTRRALVAGLAVLVVALVVVSFLSIAVGARSVGLGVVVDALRDHDPANSDHQVIANRVPRLLAGLLVGAALGLAGALMQGVARNPLADPGLLGVNAGAAFAVVSAISLGITAASGYVWFAFLGALAVAVLVYGLGALGRSGATPVKLALAGAAVSAALTSLTTAVLLTDTATFDQQRFWTVGSLAGRRPELIAQLAPFVLAGVVIALCCGRLLNALSLGDDLARGLGQRVGLARVVTGPDYRWILPYSMLIAPVLVLLSDVVGRLVIRPGELQVGVVLAFVGGPFLIALVRGRKAVAP